MRSEFWWYVARSGGIVAWALATASVLWGLALSSGSFRDRTSASKLLDLHRFLGGLSVVFVTIHMLGLVLHEPIGLGVVELLVPMSADAQPGAVAWGVLAFYLLVAVEITSMARDRVGERVWRAVHLASFGVFVFGSVHGVQAGTDVDNPLVRWPGALAVAAVLGLTAVRVLSKGSADVADVVAEERPSATLLARTLTELQRLDTAAYPPSAAPPPLAAAPPSVWSTPGADAATATPAAPPAPARLPMAAPVPPPPPAPAPEPLSMFTTGPLTRRPAPSQPAHPPQPTRTTTTESMLSRALPTRVPQRFEATTEPAAGLGTWQPSRATSAREVGPPPPPDAIDPETGEPDPGAYRKWLREWLSYVESQT